MAPTMSSPIPPTQAYEIISNVGDVDGQPMTCGFDAFAADVWYLR